MNQSEAVEEALSFLDLMKRVHRRMKARGIVYPERQYNLLLKARILLEAVASDRAWVSKLDGPTAKKLAVAVKELELLKGEHG